MKRYVAILIMLSIVTNFAVLVSMLIVYNNGSFSHYQNTTIAKSAYCSNKTDKTTQKEKSYLHLFTSNENSAQLWNGYLSHETNANNGKYFKCALSDDKNEYCFADSQNRKYLSFTSSNQDEKRYYSYVDGTDFIEIDIRYFDQGIEIDSDFTQLTSADPAYKTIYDLMSNPSALQLVTFENAIEVPQLALTGCKENNHTCRAASRNVAAKKSYL